MKEPILLREFNSVESTPARVALMKETKEKNGRIVLPNVLLQMAETKNGNGRWYPRTILEREAASYQKAVRDGRAVGELDHSQSSIIELKNVSHRISEMKWDGNRLMGTIEVLDSTPMGKILESLLLSGVRVGISSRGLGSLHNEGDKLIVEDDFQLICWDVVSDPSTPGAYLLEHLKKQPGLSKDDKIRYLLNQWRV